jgi:hypothetical protein
MTVSKDIHDRLLHVLEFTQTENTSIVYVLRGWFGNIAGIPGSLEAGDDAWSKTVMLEHYQSTLDQDPAKRTPEQLDILEKLTANAQSSQDALDKILGAGTGEDTRLNVALAAYVNSLVK